MDQVKFIDVYENWVPLLYPQLPVEFVDRYTCSNLGRFKNSRGTLINPYLSSGYYYIKLHAGDGKNLCFKRGAHQFIAYNFIPNPNNYPQVGHIDGNTSHNWADNLEWMNQSRNNLMRNMPEHHQSYSDKVSEYINRLGETVYDFGWKEWWRYPGYYGNPLGLIKYPNGTITPGNLTFGHSYYELHLQTGCKPTHKVLIEIFYNIDILYDDTNYYDGISIDHINSNPLDNRLCNLRICNSHKENMSNPNTRQKTKENRYGSSKV